MSRHRRRPEPAAPAKRPARRRLRVGRLLLVVGSLLAMVAAAGTADLFRRAIATLPPLDAPTHHLGESSVVYDAAGHAVAVLPGPDNRQPVDISQIPLMVQHAFVAVEDRRFYQNNGIDIRSILRAAVSDLEGHPLQGGSTITQQLARNLYLTQRDTLTRKIKEAILAIELTRVYTKPEILDMYLNWIPFGEHAYGIEAAAETYFGVPVGKLTLPQAALLAGLPQEPYGYDPYYHAALALARRNTVLGMMASEGYITPKQERAAQASPLGVQPRPRQPAGTISYPYPWFIDAVITQLETQDHLSPEQVTSGGLRIYTTLVPRIYDAAQKAVDRLQSTFPLSGANPMQAAVAVVDQSNGDVAALIGGRQHTTMLAYDRALSAERQPGSSIKPLVDYIPALRDGLTPGTVIDDRVYSFPVGKGLPAYVPTDYELPYYGLTTLTEALRRSVNTVAVQLLEFVGVQNGLDNAVRMGLPLTKADLHPALALGGTTDCCTPLDMALGYAAIANGGARVTPRIITRVVAPDGTVLVNNPPQIHQAVDPRIAYLMTRMLMAVDEPQPANGWDSNWGTGYDATIHDNVPGWPTAAKTGTTNNDEDAWYVGFTPLYTAAVWIGYDTPRPFPGLFGGVYAGPIFQATMEAAVQPYRPIPFRRPAGIVQAAIDVKAAPWTVAKPGPLTPPQWTRTEWFIAGTQPTKTSPLWMSVPVLASDPGLVWEPGCAGRTVSRTFLNRPRLDRAWATLVARAVGGTWSQFIPADMSLAPPTEACNGGTLHWPQVNDQWSEAPGYGAHLTGLPGALTGGVPALTARVGAGQTVAIPAQAPVGGGTAAASVPAKATAGATTAASVPAKATTGATTPASVPAKAAAGARAGAPVPAQTTAGATAPANVPATSAPRTSAGTSQSGAAAGQGTAAPGLGAAGSATAPAPGTTPGATGTGSASSGAAGTPQGPSTGGVAGGTAAAGSAGSSATGPSPAAATGATAAPTCQSDWHVTLSHGQAPAPSALCVPQGQTVYITFVATDGRVHDVMLSGYGEEAEVPANGVPVTISFVADSAGAFSFQDALDPTETGILTVQSSGSAGGTPSPSVGSVPAAAGVQGTAASGATTGGATTSSTAGAGATSSSTAAGAAPGAGSTTSPSGGA